MVEASKQCGRNRLMAIDPPRKWSEYLDMTGIGSRILLHPDPEVPRLTAAMGKGSTIAIRPEGGFSDEEVNQAIASGWRVANLGQRVTNRDGRGLAAALVEARTFAFSVILPGQTVERLAEIIRARRSDRRARARST